MNEGTRNGVKKSRNKKKKDLSVTDEELLTHDQGPISGVLSTISKAATVVAEVPLLSSVAGTVAWVSKLGANVASAFGWSDPTAIAPYTRVSNEYFGYANNVDGGDICLPLGLSVENKVAVLPGLGGTDIDEMSIKYICSIPAWFNTVVWSTTSPGSTPLIDFQLSPTSFNAVLFDLDINSDTNYYKTYMPCTLFGDLFKFYRGSFKIDFKIAKTEFHTGRLMLIYIPGPSAAVPSTDDTAYLYREIIDVSMGNEFSFIFPYASTLPYLETDVPYGRVILRVLNELNAPPTVASIVSIAMEVSMCDDVEFAVLSGNGQSTDWMVPYYPSGTTVNFVSQMNEGRSPECEIKMNGCIGPSNISDDSCVSSALCIGEKIVSVNQLIKRTTTFQVGTPLATGASRFLVRPFTLSGSSGAKVGFDSENASLFNDLLSLMASGYAYNRGSVRWRFYEFDSDDRRFQTTLLTDILGPALAKDLYWNGTIYTPSRSGYVLQDTAQTGMLSVEVPNYNQLHCRLNRYNTSFANSALYEPTDIYSSQLNLFSRTAGTGETLTDVAFARQAGDDFQLGYFIGWLPTLLDRVRAA
jgi:hypothetical protein